MNQLKNFAFSGKPQSAVSYPLARDIEEARRLPQGAEELFTDNSIPTRESNLRDNMVLTHHVIPFTHEGKIVKRDIREFRGDNTSRIEFTDDTKNSIETIDPQNMDAFCAKFDHAGASSMAQTTLNGVPAVVFHTQHVNGFPILLYYDGDAETIAKLINAYNLRKASTPVKKTVEHISVSHSTRGYMHGILGKAKHLFKP